jgi:Fic family protein
MNYEEIVGKWRENPIKDAAGVDQKLHNFRILFAYHSGKIENERIDYNDTREIFESGRIVNYTGDVRTLFEQQNQKDGFELLKAKLAQKEPLSISLIRKIHFELSKGTYDESRFAKGERPVEFKKYDYVVGYYDVWSDVAEVENDLKGLIDEVNEYQGPELLKAAAYFHAGFEQIHPFADGNGRVGRTLMNYYLMTRNHPPVVIFEEDRKEYFQALESFEKEEKLEPMVEFLVAQLIKTWGKKKK